MSTSAPAPVFASLPWYDLAEVRAATDALWRALAAAFRRAGIRGVPARLNRHVAYQRQWTSPRFLFGQACGYDVRISYAEQLQVVATPRYDVPGCEGAHYRSFVVVREDSPAHDLPGLRGGRCVINTPTSHSGMNVLRGLAAPLHCGGRFFDDVRTSGSHEDSLRMIQRGTVDVAAIDCVTHGLLARHRASALAGTRVIHQTQHVPAPPFVTSASTSPATLARMREAIFAVLDRPSLAASKAALRLSGVEILSADAYQAIESLEVSAYRHGYLEFPGALSVAG